MVDILFYGVILCSGWEVKTLGTKEQLLTLFENSKGVFFSGEEIADKLSVSRTAVWKSVKSLQGEGYPITAVRNRGYCLSVETDILSVQGIRKYLKPVCANLELNVVSTLTSTNTVAREKAMSGCADGYTIIANCQTDGRGRRGRSFYSPADTGVYLSMVLRPPRYSSQQAVKLTTMAAVAACEAIESVSGNDAQIKWVNDIYVGGKKVCGILTEASFGLEDGLLEYAVLGIGINVSPPEGGFPCELEAIAGAVFDEAQSDGKNRLAAEFLNHFMKYYTASQMDGYVESYRRRSLVIGRQIEVIASGQAKRAVALDVDPDCRLIVKYENGQIDTLFTGEISIKVF